MATFAKQIDEITECSICRDLLNDPKSLPCLHTYCLGCIQEYAKDTKPGDKSTCPFCREEFLIPQGGLSQLKSNFIIHKLVEIRKQIPGRNQTIDGRSCDICKESEGVSEVGNWRCVNCGENLCDQCCKVHKSGRATKLHQIIDINDKETQHLLYASPSFCEKHSTEEIKFYCTICKQVTCSRCQMVEHQGHKCDDIYEAVKEFRLKIQEDIERIESLYQDCKVEQNKCEAEKTQYLAVINQNEVAITEANKNIIPKHTSSLLQDLSSHKEQSIKGIEINKEEINLQLAIFESFLMHSQQVRVFSPAADVPRLAENIRGVAKELHDMALATFLPVKEIQLSLSHVANVAKENRTITIIDTLVQSSSELGHCSNIQPSTSDMQQSHGAKKVSEHMANEQQLSKIKQFPYPITITQNPQEPAESKDSAEIDDSDQHDDREHQTFSTNIGTDPTVAADNFQKEPKTTPMMHPNAGKQLKLPNTVPLGPNLKSEFLKILISLKLESSYSKRLNRRDILRITALSLDSKDPAIEEELPWQYIYKLTMLDYTARNLTCKTNQMVSKTAPVQRAHSDFGSFLSAATKESDKNLITTNQTHPMDIHMAVFHCSDNFLRQYLFGKISACQYAVPLLVPSHDSEGIEFPLWSLRQIKKMRDTKGKCMSVAEIKVPVVSFMRFGMSSVSKSQIMNKIISKKEHSIFFHRHCKGSCPRRVLMEGVAEITWYCPSDKKGDAFDRCMAFINLHGNASYHIKQVQFLKDISSVIVIVLPKSPLSEDENKIVTSMYTSSTPLICLMADDENVTGLQESSNVIIPIKKLNEADLTDEIVSCINGFSAKQTECHNLEYFATISKQKYNFKIDEDCTECEQGKEMAQELMSVLKTNSVMTVKEHVLPVSGKLWREWCQKDKELYRVKVNANIGMEQQKTEIIAKKKKVPTATLR